MAGDRRATREPARRGIHDLGADLGTAWMGARSHAPASRLASGHDGVPGRPLGGGGRGARRGDALAVTLRLGAGRGIEPDAGARSGTRVLDGAPGALLRLQGSVPLEEEVRAEL